MAITNINSSKIDQTITTVQELFNKLISSIKMFSTKIFEQISLFFFRESYERNFYNLKGHLFSAETQVKEEILIHNFLKLISENPSSSQIEKEMKEIKNLNCSIDLLNEALIVASTYKVSDDVKKYLQTSIDDIKNPKVSTPSKVTTLAKPSKYSSTRWKAGLIGAGLIILGYGLYQGYSTGVLRNLFTHLIKEKSSFIAQTLKSAHIGHIVPFAHIVPSSFNRCSTCLTEWVSRLPTCPAIFKEVLQKTATSASPKFLEKSFYLNRMSVNLQNLNILILPSNSSTAISTTFANLSSFFHNTLDTCPANPSQTLPYVVSGFIKATSIVAVVSTASFVALRHLLNNNKTTTIDATDQPKSDLNEKDSTSTSETSDNTSKTLIFNNNHEESYGTNTISTTDQCMTSKEGTGSTDNPNSQMELNLPSPSEKNTTQPESTDGNNKKKMYVSSVVDSDSLDESLLSVSSENPSSLNLSEISFGSSTTTPTRQSAKKTSKFLTPTRRPKNPFTRIKLIHTPNSSCKKKGVELRLFSYENSNNRKIWIKTLSTIEKGLKEIKDKETELIKIYNQGKNTLQSSIKIAQCNMQHISNCITKCDEILEYLQSNHLPSSTTSDSILSENLSGLNDDVKSNIPHYLEIASKISISVDNLDYIKQFIGNASTFIYNQTLSERDVSSISPVLKKLSEDLKKLKQNIESQTSTDKELLKQFGTSKVFRTPKKHL